MDITDIDSEWGVGLVILCRDKQILLGYDGENIVFMAVYDYHVPSAIKSILVCLVKN